MHKYYICIFLLHLIFGLNLPAEEVFSENYLQFNLLGLAH